jgi:N-formylglutamate amidohydrolase
MQVFDLVAAARATPVIVEVPHAGLALPEQVRGEFAAPHDCILRDADIYVDKLYERAPSRGATLLASKVSRYVVDLNRAPDDVDPLTVPDHPSPKGVQPRGVVWRMTTDGRPALRKPLTYQALLGRLEQFHTPYHDALRAELTRARSRHGFAILVAGHSMPSVGRSGHTDPGVRRADIVPGTRGRTTADARVIDLVDAHFRGAGLSVRHDDPYKGGWTTGYYGRPAEGWHAIQIELNRALYVDEETGEPKRGDFERLQTLLEQLLDKLATLDLRAR